METNKTDISSTSTCDSILKHIINCANAALQNEDAFQKAMLGLAGELRRVFDSDFCSIGIVTDGYAEDCIRSYKEFEDEELFKQQELSLKSVKRASLDDDKYIVCQALKTDKDDIFFPQEEINQFNNNKYYQSILTKGHLINSYVIPLRDEEKKIFGFIQFINSERNIDYQRDIFPYSDALLGLVQIIINNQKKQQELDYRVKDARFYDQMQAKRNNVDDLLDSIMKYFSNEFNAAMVSFRIPLLNGYEKEPLFYLRKVFIHSSIGEVKRKELKYLYYTKRLVKSKKDMNIVDRLRCEFEGKVFDNISDSDFSQFGLDLDNNTLIIPIFRDSDYKCINPLRKSSDICKNNEHSECKYRFKRLYGIFRVRISRTDLSGKNITSYYNSEEIKERLTYLSKQISFLLNSIVEKHENESLHIFQDELKNSSFIKIKDFDERCVDIIKTAVHAKVCSIYRYDDRTRLLTLNATTATTIQFNASGEKLYLNTKQIKDSCFIHIKTSDNILARTYRQKQCQYVLNIFDPSLHQSAFIEFIKSANGQETAMAIPMIKKGGACAGVVLLMGKDNHKHSISTAYWEHDIELIEFIVKMLTRMSESDTERLTFLAQLSHELLAPVTELVYDNDLTLNVAERNFESITKRQFVEKIRENIDRNMLFKYIINDTEFIYSSSGRIIDYNIVKQNRPQAILLDAIRLLEKEANESKGLTIKTYISEMPPLFFDRERMIQVFLNLLKNAIRYADKYTEISISYNKRDDGYHEIRFADVGIGIQEEEQESIFELFHRSKEAIKMIPRGTGMGLYIARDIMRAHGGDCYVRRLDNPTEFAITLPNRE